MLITDKWYAELGERIRASLELLTEREKDVLIMRFGLLTGTIMSLEEIAKQLSMTKMRIGVIEKRALHKLREGDNLQEWHLYGKFPLLNNYLSLIRAVEDNRQSGEASI